MKNIRTCNQRGFIPFLGLNLDLEELPYAFKIGSLTISDFGFQNAVFRLISK